MKASYWLSLSSIALVAACAPAADVPPDAPPPAPPAPNVVTVTTTDHAFDAPAEMPAGVTTFKLVNNGNTSIMCSSSASIAARPSTT